MVCGHAGAAGGQGVACAPGGPEGSSEGTNGLCSGASLLKPLCPIHLAAHIRDGGRWILIPLVGLMRPAGSMSS